MLKRSWQAIMIAMARSTPIKRFMQTSRATSFLSGQYVAGETPADAIARAHELLASDGIKASLFYMGEYVDRLDMVETNITNKLAAVDALHHAHLDIHISLDPTQIGHHIDPAMVAEQAEKIAMHIQIFVSKTSENRTGINCLMFDMEDAALNDPTIALHNQLQDKGYPVALTLQAYLRRTFADMEQQIMRGSRVRLVKGAFAAGRAIAFTRQKDIKDNSRKIIDLMFSASARDAGFYPIIATHDTKLQKYAIDKAQVNGWAKSAYEFEMLLGVRADVARALAARGEQVRLYVPFGKDWWPHAVRRIGENPRNAVLLARSLLT